MTPTPSQTVGPFYAIGLCRHADDELATAGIELTGTLYDGRGEPLPDGLLELWDPVGRRWGRSETQPDGRFRFLIPRGIEHVEAIVFARGLLRHQLTRIYFCNNDDATLVARRDGDSFRHDIHLQGDRETTFYAL